MRSGFHAIVRGRVQGVAFRASTCQEARRLGLSGWVRNCADGSVELLACGAEPELTQLKEWLRHGPALARVDELCVTATPAEADGAFEVRY